MYDDIDVIDSGHNPGSTTLRSFPVGFNGIWQGVSEDSVEYSFAIAQFVQEEVSLAFSSKDPLKYVPSNNAVSLFGSEIKRFICAIDGYINSPNPILTYDYLYKGILDYNFAKTLKEIRIYALTRSYDAQSLTPDGLDSYKELGLRKIYDIGQVFNYKYWFRWHESSDKDYLFSQIPVKEVEDDKKERFKDALRNVLPKSFSVVLKDEILLSNSSSSSRLPGGKTSKVVRDKEDPSLNYFSKEPLRGYYTEVYKGPCEVRECITLTVSQSNTVKWIEKQMAEVARHTQYSAYGLTKPEFHSVLEKFQKSNVHFYNRDLTKEGWTKPRWMLFAIQEVLKEIKPDLEVLDYFSIFSKVDLYLPSGILPMLRGHGLGMANALTTICQSAFFEYCQLTEGEYFENVDALFYNDDASFGSTEDHSIMSYVDHEEPLMLELGLILKEKKTYVGEYSVLCESFYPHELNKKESYWDYVRRIPFASSCCIEAKGLAYLTTDVSIGSPREDLLKKLIEFFGVEYSSEELSLPWWAGGWNNLSYRGVDLTFLELESSQLLNRGLRVGKPRLKPNFFKKYKGTYRSPAEYLYETRFLDEVVSKALGIRRPKGEVYATYNRGMHRLRTEEFLKYETNRRQKEWRSPAKPLDVYEIYLEILEKYPWKDFIPPEGLFTEVPMEVCSVSCERRVPLWPRQPNKILGSLCWFQGMRYERFVIPWPWIPGLMEDNKEIDFERLEKSREGMMKQGFFGDYWKNPHSIIEHRVLKQYDWNNSYNVWQAWATLTGTTNQIRPVHHSLGAKYVDERANAVHFADLFGSEELWLIWTSISRSLGIFILNGNFNEDKVTTEEFNWMLGISDEEPEPQISIKEEPPDIEEYTADFAEWKWGYKKYQPFPGLENLFNLVARLLYMGSSYLSMASMSDQRLSNEKIPGMPEHGSPEDLAIKRLTKVCGNFSRGIYYYSPPQNDSFWEEEEDEGGGAMGGLFD